jgi:hypothetical protein
VVFGGKEVEEGFANVSDTHGGLGHIWCFFEQE